MTKYPAYVFTDKRETYCFSCIAIIEINSDTLRMFNYFSHLKKSNKNGNFKTSETLIFSLFQLEKHNLIDNIFFVHQFVNFMSGT